MCLNKQFSLRKLDGSGLNEFTSRSVGFLSKSDGQSYGLKKTKINKKKYEKI